MISIYTDGSCNTVYKIGGWASIIFIGGEKIILSGSELETTHQRMELTAAVKAINHLQTKKFDQQDIWVYTDSQYLAGLADRRIKLLTSGLTTKRDLPLPNADLIRQLFQYQDLHPLHFTKIKSHEKLSVTANYNREVDKLSRKIVRESVKNIYPKH